MIAEGGDLFFKIVHDYSWHTNLIRILSRLISNALYEISPFLYLLKYLLGLPMKGWIKIQDKVKYFGSRNKLFPMVIPKWPASG